MVGWKSCWLQYFMFPAFKKRVLILCRQPLLGWKAARFKLLFWNFVLATTKLITNSARLWHVIKTHNATIGSQKKFKKVKLLTQNISKLFVVTELCWLYFLKCKEVEC